MAPTLGFRSADWFASSVLRFGCVSETDTAHRTGETSHPAGNVATCNELLTRLKDAPDDLGLRERTARACSKIGRDTKAVEILRDHFVHLNAHDWGALPCLCKRCLISDRAAAQVEETHFVRDFAIAAGRLLYFWTPTDLEHERRQVVASVTSKLRDQLKKKTKL